MIYAIAATAILLLLIAVVRILAYSDPAHLARLARLGGPILFGLAGTALIALGKVVIGGLCYALAFAAFTLASRRPPRPSGHRIPHSSVRTAALDMELDHDTGALEGLVLAGRHEQRALSSLTLQELLEVYHDIRGDSESRQLLEAYLDSRFPVWRSHGDPNGDPRKRIPPGSGAMTEQEAYKVLGLEAGATTAQIREAHRRLIQSLNPHVGGTSALALRINKAKDILLAKHD